MLSDASNAILVYNRVWSPAAEESRPRFTARHGGVARPASRTRHEAAFPDDTVDYDTFGLHEHHYKNSLILPSQLLGKYMYQDALLQYFFICPESRRTYIATVSKILFFFSIELKHLSVRFGPIGLRNCYKISYLCILTKILHTKLFK